MSYALPFSLGNLPWSRTTKDACREENLPPNSACCFLSGWWAGGTTHPPFVFWVIPDFSYCFPLNVLHEPLDPCGPQGEEVTSACLTPLLPNFEPPLHLK